jgi:uncharacterized C2H2 Zn-finger protein
MTVPAPLRQLVWFTYMKDILEGLCQICLLNLINPFQFTCAHVLAINNGGEDILENLRPICWTCNLSMGTRHMTEFVKKHFPNSPLLEDLPPIPKTMTHYLKYGQSNPMTIEELAKYVRNNRDALISFEKQQRLEKSNQKREVHHIKIEEIGAKIVCPHCSQTFAQKASLTRHLNANTCTQPKVKKADLIKSMKEMSNKIDKIEKKIFKKVDVKLGQIEGEPIQIP